jgi:hypothetical protein
MQKPLFEPWSIAIEPYLDGNDDWTLSELIEMVILEAATVFKTPPHDATFLRAVNARIAIPEVSDSDNVKSDQTAMDSQIGEAIASALQAFEEDVYLVVLDSEDVMDLDDEIELKPDSQVTFVRLVPLSTSAEVIWHKP